MASSLTNRTSTGGVLASVLPMGRHNPHITESHGADTDVMKFYHTRYGNEISAKWSGFKGKSWRHKGTGYAANLRPQIFYTRRLDELDNPFMGHLCTDNYHSITDKSFKAYNRPNGTEIWPFYINQKGENGFTREKVHNPTSKEAAGVHFDTRQVSAPADFLPKAVPFLHRLQNKDPTENEHFRYGPAYMESEAKAHYNGEPLPDVELYRKTVGPIEDTGHTHNLPLYDAVQQKWAEWHKHDLPDFITNRPIGPTIYNTHYVPMDYPNGTESNPGITSHSDRNTGFTRENFDPKPMYAQKHIEDAYDHPGQMDKSKLADMKKTDPAEFLNVTNPNPHSSVYKSTYMGEQWPPETICDRLGRTTIADKQPGGAVENNDTFVQTDDDPTRFSTRYQEKYRPWTLTGRNREGHLHGGLHALKDDGFTRSTKTDDTTAVSASNRGLRYMMPYQARSLKARDKFYDDHTYDYKQPKLRQAFMEKVAA